MEIPTENKAWTYSKHGQPADVLSMSDLPIPSLSPSQVLVEIKAAGFNPVSYKAMKTFPSFMVKKPCVPENDLSGVVVASASTEFAKGDEVLGIIPAELQFKTGFGTLGKYAIVEHAHLVKKPSSVSWEQAACLPLAGMTAWDALVETGHIKEGDRVFINGGSGGVGVMAVQIAKAMVGEGGYVAASCSAANIELVRSLGAHDALDYKEFAKGDEVLGIIPAELQFKTGFGTLGKYAIVEHAHLVKKPSSVSWEQAACLPLAGMTAWDALVETGHIKEGDRVFINGGSGGVGVMAVQIAKAMVGEGGYVAASCSAANIELVRSLGAHDALDYKESDLSTQLATKYPVAEGKGFDIFFDTVGVQQLFDKCASYLNQNGTFVSISGDLGTAGEIAKTGKDLFMNKFLPTVLGGVPRKFSFILMKTSKDKLLKLATLCDEGKLRPVVDSTHDFNNVLEAYSVMMSGRAKGKVIVKGPSSDFYPSSSSPSSSSSSESSSSSGARIIH
eukprot:TRINITY_DN2298_c0_g1_i2.p1 TRINITY_DN2298_c0_g1~~TRINITY_DN2298_c0_g1_i2.p1  ORF type:complete len:503 (+),score=197.22 TRINITY_DN2298_c0_g1_i2:61-1569(+)